MSQQRGAENGCPVSRGVTDRDAWGTPVRGRGRQMPSSMTATSNAPFDRAIALHRGGDLAGAECGYNAALALDAGDARATQMLGVLAFQTGRATMAVGLLRRAAELAPDSPECHGNLGLVLDAAGHPTEAIAAYRRAIALKPDFGEAHVNLGTALRQAGDPAGAAAAYRCATQACPDLSQAHYNLGLLLAEQGQFAQALPSLRRACQLRPDGGEEQLTLANTLFHAGDMAAAATAFARAVELQPASADAWNNLGTALDRLGRPAEAATAFGHAVRLQPDRAEGHFNLAAALRRHGRCADAITTVRRALALRPEWPEAWNNLGVWLLETNRPTEAAEAFARAIALRPDHAEAHCNLGSVLRQAGRSAEAIACYRRAVALRPDYAEAMSNLGSALERAGEVDEGIATLRQAVALRPDLSEAHNNLGNALKEAGDLDGALACWSRAVELRPDNVEADSNRVYTLLYHAGADAAAHRDAAVAWGRRHAAPLAGNALPHGNDPTPGRRLRVGYVAPDFRDHCQSFFTIPLLSNHDRERFEVLCYADVAAPDAVTRRVRQHADVWRDTAGLSDGALAEQVRADGIDVLVDLTVHMSQHRLLAFARRPAPVQVTWLGYPGTTGVQAIDYRLSDPYLDPPGDARDVLYAERTVRLPDTFWCYDPLIDGVPVGGLPAAHNGFVTFGCLNNFCKVTDGTLRLWGRVLGRVPGSRLLLLTPAGSARRRVLDVLGDAGVDAGRVAFVGRQPRRSYLETYHRIDVGLDTVPYNGHTTSLDSCWMGVPVVTRVGEAAVGRAGWGQLSNLGLTHLAAHDDEAFVSIATSLAGDLDGLAAMRATLRQRLVTSPLGDGPRFARNVEAAYRQMWVAHCERC
jgi:protein O-GlcNAc transferase